MTDLELDAFLAEYARNDRAWWRLSLGEMQNVVDALIERCEDISERDRREAS